MVGSFCLHLVIFKVIIVLSKDDNPSHKPHEENKKLWAAA